MLALTGAALFMVVLDNLIVGSTLPSIQRALHARWDELEWILDAYILSFGALMLTAAALGERYGRRRVFTAGVLLFTGASAASALAPSPGLLIAARTVQGIGGAIVLPLSLTLLAAAFPGERRAAALGTWSAISGLGVALGPVVGGALTAALSWHWIFWVNLPIGLVTAALTPRYVTESRGAAEAPDTRGLALVSSGLLAVVWATIRGNAQGWTSVSTLAAYAIGLVLLAAFARWERRTAAPMVPPRLFASRPFTAATVASFLFGFAMFAGFLMVIQYLAHVRGEGPLSSGAHTLFWTAVPMVVSPLAARLGRRVAPLALVGTGLALTSAGLALVAFAATASASPLAIAPGLVAVGLGIGFVLPNIAATALTAVAAGEIGKASGVVNTSRQLGAVFGVAVSVALLQSASTNGGLAGVTAGVHAGLVAAVVAASVGTGVAVVGRRVPRRVSVAAAAPSC